MMAWLIVLFVSTDSLPLQIADEITFITFPIASAPPELQERRVALGEEAQRG